MDKQLENPIWNTMKKQAKLHLWKIILYQLSYKGDFQDGEHMYTYGGFILIFGKTNTVM